jgi:hypothetical protein
MARAQAPCARAEGHLGYHMTAESVRKMYDRSIVYHTEQRARRMEKINQYKLDRGCIDCGYNDDPVALDFDHRDPSRKLAGVAAMMTFSWARIIAELDKCAVRCANCHRIKTYNMHEGQNRRRPAPDSEVRDGPSS